MSDPAQTPAVAKKRLGTGTVIGLVLILGVVGGIGGTWLRGTDNDSGPTYPSSWDPRITSLVSYVEAHRGLTYKHPVYVEFLSDAEFDKEVTSDGSDLTAADKKDLANQEAFMRSLGLISGKTDLFQASNELQGSGVLGLYNNEDKKIRVRGDQLTPSVRVTLVHELTHVLQDQYYDLLGTFKRLDADKTADSSAFHAIVEGDAVRIQDGYSESLSAADRAAIAKQDAADSQRFQKGAGSVPEIMQAMFSAPYPLGEFAVQTAFAKDGNAGVDALFTAPPITDGSIVDPYLIDTPLTTPAIPDLALGAGETEVDRGTFSSLPLYLMLAKTMPYASALTLAEKDANDRYLQYAKGSTSCVRAEFEGRDTSVSQLARGLQVWAQKARTGATVSQSGNTVTINACDPGTAYVPTPDHSNDAIGVLVTRNAIYASVRGDGVPAGFASCYSDAVIKHFTTADLSRLNDNEMSAADKATLQQLGLGCRSQLGASPA